jgi:hypothetical protein
LLATGRDRHLNGRGAPLRISRGLAGQLAGGGRLSVDVIPNLLTQTIQQGIIRLTEPRSAAPHQ